MQSKRYEKPAISSAKIIETKPEKARRKSSLNPTAIPIAKSEFKKMKQTLLIESPNRTSSRSIIMLSPLEIA